jgi:hypothetical protein
MPLLSDAINAVRAELERARQTAEGQTLQFEVGAIEMEFDIALTGTKGLDGIDVKVVSVGAKWMRETTATHRIKVALKPMLEDGRSPKVSTHLSSVAPSRD